MTDQERINALEERVRNLEGLMATALQQSCAPDMTRNIDLSLRTHIGLTLDECRERLAESSKKYRDFVNKTPLRFI